jgi:mannitol 2-dehydrogenase
MNNQDLQNKNQAALNLSSATIANLSEQVLIPNYDRNNLVAGIMHFGVGGFHRAHQALVIDDLLNQGLAREWAICGVGIMPFDTHMRDVLKAQDGLYTLVVKHPNGQLEPRVIGSIIDYLYAPDDVEAVIKRLTLPEVKIVSLTITEGGYNIHPVTGQFDLTNAQIIHDLSAGPKPSGVFGMIVEALMQRREKGIKPFTIMSCDNLQDNGHVAKRSFVAYAKAKDAELARWIETSVSFPNSMVDRITPVTTDHDRLQLSTTYQVADRWPVMCEPFLQWVIQDNFSDGRPPFEQSQVQLVTDVEPYELMKLRLLNVSHQGLCYFAYLMGYRWVHEAASDPLIAKFLRAYMDREASPTLKPVIGINLEQYKSKLIERFANPSIADTVVRLAAESSDRIPKWLLPIVREQTVHAGEVAMSAAIVASWARYAEGTDEEGNIIAVVDHRKERVMQNARGYAADPHAFLRDRDLMGDMLENVSFVRSYDKALDLLHRVGARRTLEVILSEIGVSL